MGVIDIRRTGLTSPDAERLIAALNAELAAAFPEPGANHFSLSSAQVGAGAGAFVVAYLDDIAVGCGAVRRLDAAAAELKRMYVDPSARGCGIGRALVEALEREARLLGVTRIVLETGTRLTPAIGLYKSMGYMPIPLFGEYLSSPDTSLCFGKRLHAEDPKRALLVHFLAALAYRTRKALRGAPPQFGQFEAGHQVRQPRELLRHMTNVLGCARTVCGGGTYTAPPPGTMEEEILRFHNMVEELGRRLDSDAPLRGFNEEQLLQGPLSDAMTHAGQLALLRRLAGAPVPAESFIDADI